MFFDVILWVHIVSSLGAFGVAIYLFFWAKGENRLGYVFLMVLLAVTALSGIPLNTLTFSPFHALALLTLVNVPLSWRAFKRGRERTARDNLFQNSLGLFVALVGTTHPYRFIGSKLYNEVDIELAQTLFAVSMGVSVAIVLVLLYLAYKDKLPYAREYPKSPSTSKK